MHHAAARRRLPLQAPLAAALAALLLLGPAARPADAQVPGIPGLPGAEALPSLSDLVAQIGDIEGLAPLDPVLSPVLDIVLELEQLLGLGGEPTSVNSFALAGDDAVEAAIAFSEAAFPDGAGTAVLGRDDLFADGMSSAGFQGVFDAPLLLTGGDDLDTRTGLELQRLGMSAITILGGEDALDPLVVSKLAAAGLQVTRVGGPTRVETAILAADATSPAASHAVLVRAYPDAGQPDSQAYADLLAAGPYAAENGWPVLMTTSATLHPGVQAQLADLDAVTIIGGTDAIAPAVETALTSSGVTVDRIAGANRFATAVAIAEARGFTSSADPDQIVLAEQGGRDDVWAPGFAATAYADGNDAPVLLSDGDTLPEETLAFLGAGVEENLADGGPAIICAPFVSRAACEGAGAVVIGNASDASGILGIPLEDLPLIGDILDALGGAGLLPDELQGIIDGLLGGGASPEAITGLLEGLASGDPDAIIEALEGLGDLLPGGGDGGPGIPGLPGGSGNPVLDLLQDLLGGGLPGFGSAPAVPTATRPQAQ